MGLSADAVAALLREVDLFSGLDAATLVDLGGRAGQRSFRRGAPLFHQGDPGDSVFVLASGRVKLSVTSPEGDELVLATLEPPASFGELAIIDGGDRAATAEATAATTVVVIARTTFLDLLTSSPAAADQLLRSMGALVRRVTEQASDLVFLDLPGRLAKLIVGLAERAADGVIDLHLTQKELGSLLGGTRQSVNQGLRTFERLGWLEPIDARRVAVLDLPSLRRRAGLVA